MAMRHDDLTEEQLELKRDYERSWENAQRQLADPEFRTYLEASIERVNTSSAPRTSREEFLAATESVDPEWCRSTMSASTAPGSSGSRRARPRSG